MNTEQRARELLAEVYGFEPGDEVSKDMAIRAIVRALSPPASAGEGFVVVPRGAVDLAADVAQDWLTLFPEMPGLEKYERFTYGPAVEQLRDDLRAILTAPTPPAAAQEDGRDAARRERDRLFCEAIVANQFQDEHRGGRLTVDVETLLHYFNENRPDAAMLTSPDSGKENT
jgi:hypothetical protein